MQTESQIDDQTITRYIGYCGVLVAIIGYGLYTIASLVA